ncbi:hypothetical protein J4440_00180 [Candidatus Woesearchaeota archaeon]|nr:hypothetical protein [Candidatus Woesearchaeota archaeon]
MVTQIYESNSVKEKYRLNGSPHFENGVTAESILGDNKKRYFTVYSPLVADSQRYIKIARRILDTEIMNKAEELGVEECVIESVKPSVIGRIPRLYLEAEVFY